MELFTAWIKEHLLGFRMELFFAGILFLISLNKRSPAKIWVTAGVGGYLALAAVVRVLMTAGMPRELGLLILFVLLMAFLYCSARITVWDSIFGAACAYAMQHLAYSVFEITEAFLPVNALLLSLEILIKAGVYAFCYFCFAKKVSNRGGFGTGAKDAFSSVFFILPVVFWLYIVAGRNVTPESMILYRICRLFGALCCFFVLWVQTTIRKSFFMKQEFETEQLLWSNQKKQYEISKENIELINQKCHDLKHQVAALRKIQDETARERSLREMEKAVMLYDSMMKTGNEALDTVLTEKSLICERENITWTCIADGAKLAFMDVVDLYSLLGNALDNSIECVTQLSDPEKRVISVNLFAKKDIFVIQIENHFDGTLVFDNDLPVTTKKETDYHGYGLRSIRKTVEKYNGSLSIDAMNNTFMLCAIVPLP